MGLTLIVAGAAIAAVSLGADAIGIGEGTAVGYKQTIGAIVGAIISVIGLTRLGK